MKKYWSLLMLLPVLVFGQEPQKNYDYFVQFNLPSFVKKVPLETILQHKLFNKSTADNSKLKIDEFIAWMDQSKPIVVHGNMTDSLSYYQVTIPILEGQKVQQFLEKRVAENRKDSILDTLKIFPKYQVYSPAKESFSLAWNKNYLILYSVLNENTNVSDTAVEEIDGPPVEELVVEELKSKVDEKAVEVVEDTEVAEKVSTTDETSEETVTEQEEQTEEQSEEVYDDAYYQKQDEEYRIEQERIRLEKQVRQEKQIALLFENGFEMPTSSKVNPTSDISCWLNYQAFSTKMSSFYYSLQALFPNKKWHTSENAVKGMNMDLYFENEKTRVVQNIEYSEAFAKMMRKVVSRKPNKDTYKFFPKTEPIGYMSYHFNSEEILKHYPEFTEQLMMNLPFEKEDTQIITDLLSTIIDEKATATLFDGDVSVFWHAAETFQHTFKNIVYNEDYEEVEEDKTILKTRPIFSMVMTSSHATMVNRLLDLGVRKKVLVKENNVYHLKKQSAEIGDLTFAKEGDAFVITNGWDYLTDASNSDFTKQFKKEIRNNYLIGNLNIGKMTNDLSKSMEQEKDITLMHDFGKQFKNMQFHSEKKIKDNVATFEMEMTTNNSEKNSFMEILDFLAKF